MASPTRVLIVLLISGLVSACGGESAISRDDFIVQADAICAAAGEELDSFGDSLGPDSTEEDVSAAISEAAALVQQSVDDIRALGFPEGDDEELTAIYDDLDAAVARLRDDPLAAISSGDDPFEGVNERLNAYGLADCGS